ncbi:hypothetical protein L6249_00225 [Candidatus Parcubacteria bacterium]|nr:hypothetical protein [Patescibacteria group bacterium]MCG2690488.1 hypothetical protein [Candidatus Parcubacteria bacterium]
MGLARALATQSKLLLLDEPLSALDAKIGAYLRYELKRIVKKNHLTAIHVTHNQEEAMTISDNIILMRGGEIVQTGSPIELINFLGHLYEYRINVNGATVRAYKRYKEEKVRRKFKAGDKISFWFYPEDVLIFKEPNDFKKELRLD